MQCNSRPATSLSIPEVLTDRHENAQLKGHTIRSYAAACREIKGTRLKFRNKAWICQIRKQVSKKRDQGGKTDPGEIIRKAKTSEDIDKGKGWRLGAEAPSKRGTLNKETKIRVI